MRVVKRWHRLLREVVDAPSLETFQARLDGAPSNLIELEMSQLITGGWARRPLEVPSNANSSDSVILQNGSKAAICCWK